MTDDEIQKLPNTSHLMSKEEFAAWIAGRKEAGAKIDIGTAELEGWWAPEGDPYAFSYWAPKGVDRNTDGSPELCPYFFVRDPESRGWVWQDDLPDDKRATMQARIDEHNRKVKEFYADRLAAGRLIDIETCEGFLMKADGIDPYGVELAPYGCIGTTRFVCNKDSGGPIYVGDLPEEKRQALDERAKRERLARKHIIDGLFDA